MDQNMLNPAYSNSSRNKSQKVEYKRVNIYNNYKYYYIYSQNRNLI